MSSSYETRVSGDTSYPLHFRMVSSAGAAVTSITPACKFLQPDGVAFVSAGGTVAEVSNGYYTLPLLVTDLPTQGFVKFLATGAGAVDTTFTIEVLSIEPMDKYPNAVPASSLSTVFGTPSGVGVVYQAPLK